MDDLYGPYDLKKIRFLLSLEKDEDLDKLFSFARKLRDDHIGNQVYLRGLIEFSNRCAKNCFYCGIRKGNHQLIRYELSDEEVVEAACFAAGKKYGSIVLQSGERKDRSFTDRITHLLEEIHSATGNRLRVTLSCGEQNAEVYKRWFEAGASRYLLRIETSNPELYTRIHPSDSKHDFSERVKTLQLLVKTGYRTGTGVMIGLPFQTHDDLANDLLFIRDSGVHMVGMGPYVDHSETPMHQFNDILLPKEERVKLTLKMTAILRILRPSINIASATALQTLDEMGREKGLMAGANVIMPNITPSDYKKKYTLYEGKPCVDDHPEYCSACLEDRIKSSGCVIAYDQWGDR